MKTTTQKIGQKSTTIVKPNQLTNEEINTLILETRTNHGFISIKGYVNSQGAVTNYLVQPLGENGYKNLIQKSIDEIDQLENKKEFDEVIFKLAKKELKESFNKTLNDEHNITNNYSKETKGFYSHEDNDATYIRNIVIVKREVLIEGEKKVVKSREKTLAKNYLKNRLPIGKYQGCFKLDSSKFEQLTFNKTSIINN